MSLVNPRPSSLASTLLLVSTCVLAAVSTAIAHFAPQYSVPHNAQPQQPQHHPYAQFVPTQVGGIYHGGQQQPQAGSPFIHQFAYTPAHAPRSDISPCDYLLKAPIHSVNGGPFVIKTRARAGVTKATAGQPIEVSIAPFSAAYQGLNFTSFIIYAKPTSAAPTSVPEYMREFLPPAASPAGRHVGVFQVFRRFSAEAGSMKCSPLSKQEDSVGAYEDLILPAHQAHPARNRVSFLWWPTAEALKFTEIVFVANIKSNGRWYSLKSTPWKVNRPIDIQARQQKNMKRMNYMIQWMRRMERMADRPGAAM